MASYKLLTFAGADSAATPGLLVGDTVLDLGAELNAQGSKLPSHSVRALLERWDDAQSVLSAIADSPDGGTAKALGEVTLLAPIPDPGTIFCAAANYYDHAREMSSGRELDKSKLEPYFFIKSNGAITAPGAPIHLPVKHSQKFDWEAELGAVIGRPARNVSEGDALGYVAGYTIVNDMSARDHMKREDWPFGSDWFSQKSWENSAPMGPWLTPAADIADPQDLTVKTWISGELMQDSSTDQMVFSVAELVAAISKQLTLRPGDVIPTGTCAGVGAAKGRFLKPGDDIKIEIEGLGTLANPCVEGS